MANRFSDTVKNILRYEFKDSSEPVGVSVGDMLAILAVSGAIVGGAYYLGTNAPQIMNGIRDFISADEEQGAGMSSAHKLTLG